MRFTVSVLPAIAFLLLKIYSWIVVMWVCRELKTAERKAKFGAQWITNTLIASPNIRLTLPVRDHVPESYERL